MSAILDGTNKVVKWEPRMAAKLKTDASKSSKKKTPPSPRNNRVLGHKTAEAIVLNAPAPSTLSANAAMARVSAAMGLKKKSARAKAAAG